MRALPAWRVTPDGTGIERSFRVKNFSAAASFVSAAADAANAAGHHPDLHITEYNLVRVVLTTHAAGGVTLADVALAARLDALPVPYSPKWLRESGVACGG